MAAPAAGKIPKRPNPAGIVCAPVSRNDAVLTVFAAILIAFSLVVAIVIPRRDSTFPGPKLRLFALIAVLLVAAMLTAVEVLGESHHFGEAGGEGETATEATGGEGATTGETGEGATTGEEGGGEAAELGRQVFDANQCANCHTLEAAGATGTIGPNLDDSDVTVEQAIEQITNGGGGMPPFGGQLSEEEIRAVAEFVTG
jgi:mono/diheme cytochrome c family protein